MPTVPDAKSMAGSPFSVKKTEAHPEAPRNKGVRSLLHLILFKKVSS